jgi:hypothetical protein
VARLRVKMRRMCYWRCWVKYWARWGIESDCSMISECMKVSMR